MCLFTKNKRQRATHDIVCYKKISVYNGRVLSPFMFHEIPMQVIEGKEPYIAKGKQMILEYGLGSEMMIGGGFIHTYENLSVAYRLAGEDDLIIKCVIPKGTYYFKGDDGNCHPSYAARKIKFIPTPEQIDAIFVKKITI